MASAKVSNSLSGGDAEEGNELDDDGGFVMTRTAGKRRLNVSAADMVANEILDDVNEDLIMDDDETTDPIKRLHRGYMNEAVAMADEPSADNVDDDSDCGSAEDYDDDKKEYTEDDWQKVDPSKARIVNPDIIHECSLYVTVEPCIMCASMLRQYGIKKVYFGAANDKFGGTGGVLRIHMNSKPNERVQQNVTYIETYVTNMMSRPKRSSRPSRPPISVDTAEAASASASASADAQLSDSASTPSPTDSTEGQEDGKVASMTTTITRTVMTTDNTNNPPVIRHSSTIPIAEGAVPARDEGHGGNVEPGFDVEGGWGRDKAVFLLRQFYVQENGRAPAPRKKEGRAQRLVEQMKCETESTIKLPSTLEQLQSGALLAATGAQALSPSAALDPTSAVPMATETNVKTTSTETTSTATTIVPFANITNASND
ncbi:MAG: tRNA(adenine34) deaminase [Sporothrix thermara]